MTSVQYAKRSKGVTESHDQREATGVREKKSYNLRD